MFNISTLCLIANILPKQEIKLKKYPVQCDWFTDKIKTIFIGHYISARFCKQSYTHTPTILDQTLIISV